MTLEMGLIQSLTGLEKLVGKQLGPSQFLNDVATLSWLTSFDVTHLYWKL